AGLLCAHGYSSRNPMVPKNLMATRIAAIGGNADHYYLFNIYFIINQRPCRPLSSCPRCKRRQDWLATPQPPYSPPASPPGPWSAAGEPGPRRHVPHLDPPS
ncbi:MAG TPA: hypothetical protein VE965_06355, partial [Gammaproteobacteria bacterium]|nr:hypothetical protein [Gammaproteobacteria bacterium]